MKLSSKQLALAWIWEKTQAHKVHAEDSELRHLAGDANVNFDEARKHIYQEVERMHQRASEYLEKKDLLERIKERLKS